MCSWNSMVSRFSVEGNAKTGERSMGGPPDDVNGLNYWYSTTEETPLPSKQTHLKCPRALMRLKSEYYPEKRQKAKCTVSGGYATPPYT